MTQPPRFFALLLVFCVSVAGLHAADSDNDFPNLKAAVESLQAAKDAEDAEPKLEEALKHLQDATSKAAGKKDEAIGLVNDAIQLAKDGKDKTELTNKIDHAITALRMGMRSAARGRK